MLFVILLPYPNRDQHGCSTLSRKLFLDNRNDFRREDDFLRTLQFFSFLFFLPPSFFFRSKNLKEGGRLSILSREYLFFREVSSKKREFVDVESFTTK